MKSKSIISRLMGTTALVVVVSVACNKDLNKVNPNAFAINGYFNTSAKLQNGTNAIYSVVHSLNLMGREWFFIHDLRSDDVATGGGQLEVPRAQLLNGTSDPTNSVMNAVFNNYYTVILRANTVITNGPVVTDNTALRDRLVGEAKFLRAWAYFELVTMWGPVPVYTALPTSPGDVQPRSKVSDVYALIIKDLKDAVAILPGKSGYGASDQGRATNAAANVLLGRAYMQQLDFANAKAALLAVPTSGPDGYTLTARYKDNFEEETEFNPESIWEVVFVDKGDANFNWGGNSVGDGPTADQSTVRNQEFCPVAWRNLIPSNHILNEFENTAVAGNTKSDPRFGYTVYQTGDLFDNGTATLTDALQNGNGSVIRGTPVKTSYRKYTLIYKQSVATAGFYPGGNNMRIMRLAEVYLNLAECYNETGDIPNALLYLNKVRNRTDVAMPTYPTANYPSSTKDQVRQTVMHEKNVEMAVEEVRNIDIMRWRAEGLYAAGSDPLPYFKANRDELLPIPQAEIDNNPKLAAAGINAQNPGY